MKFCDTSNSVVRWGSEEVVIPYISPIDKKSHRYYVDFILELKQPNGSIKTLLIEIKPKKQCAEPKKPKRITKTYVEAVHTWITNTAKWRAAESAAKNRDWEFRILTEDNLFRKGKNG